MVKINEYLDQSVEMGVGFTSLIIAKNALEAVRITGRFAKKQYQTKWRHWVAVMLGRMYNVTGLGSWIITRV